MVSGIFADRSELALLPRRLTIRSSDRILCLWTRPKETEQYHNHKNNDSFIVPGKNRGVKMRILHSSIIVITKMDVKFKCNFYYQDEMLNFYNDVLPQISF